MSSKKHNQTKSEQLGVSFGAANNRLRKLILFDLVVKLEQDTCFQCGQKITHVDDFSVEHKIPWLHSESPEELFYDLENIAFSHLTCNVSSRRNKIDLEPCGTITSYQRGCRCSLCKDAKSLYSKYKYSQEDRHTRYIKYGN